jgi:translation elongation factor EF-Tu-like GTPase
LAEKRDFEQIDNAPEEKERVLQLTQHMLNMKLITGIMLM